MKNFSLQPALYIVLAAAIFFTVGCPTGNPDDLNEPDDDVPGISVSNVTEWNTVVNDIKNGGDSEIYTLNVTGNFNAPSTNDNIFGTANNITVIIQGNGTISSTANGSLFRVGAGQTVILKDVTLKGHSGNDSPVVVIMPGGVFQMEGNAKVTGNTNSSAGGIYVHGGTLIMKENAQVSGNTKS